MLRRTKVMMFVIIALIGIVAFNTTSANAASQSQTITSAYDDQSDDSLTLQVDYTTPECDKPNGGDVPWFTDLQVTNTSSNTDVDVSFVPNTGGTLPPGNSTMHRYSSSGTNDLQASFTFAFSVKTAQEETATITIAAPACASGAGVSGVNCTLLNFTDQSVRDDNGDYPKGTLLKLEAILSGDNSSNVKTLVYQTTIDGGPTRILQDSASTKMDFTLDQLGRWEIVAVLKDADGNIVSPDDPENCIVYLDVVKAEDSTPPSTTPPTTTPPTTVPPATTPDTSSNAGSGTTNTTSSGVLGSTTSSNDASADTLPVTGAHTTTMVMVSLALLMIGGLLTFLGRLRKPRPIVDPEWMHAMQALGNE